MYAVIIYRILVFHCINLSACNSLFYIHIEQLNKIDDDMKKLLMDKLNILRAMQGGVGGHRSTDSTPKHVLAKDLDTPKAIVARSSY